MEHPVKVNGATDILLVDDRPENLMALEAALEGPGQNLVKARSGVEALKYLLDKEFAVIVLDVHMPGMGGFETAALIRERERTRHTPIIFTTAAHRSEVDVFRGYSIGAVDYLFSPFVPEVLRAKVEALAGLSKLRQDLEKQLEETRSLNQKLDQANHELAYSQAMLRRLNETLEQRVAERTRELSTLLNISRDVASTLQLGPLMSIILDQLKLLVDYTNVAIYLLDGDELSVMDYRGPVPRDEALQVRFPVDRSMAHAEIMRTRAPVIIPDIQGDFPPAVEWREQALEVQERLAGDARAWMCVPLTIKDRVIGILRLEHQEPDYFQPRHAELAMAMASQAAIAIENARLYEQAQQVAALRERQRLARELHDSVSQVLYGIGLGTRTAQALLEQDPDKATAALDYILSLAAAGLAEMRALIFELHPESLEKEGLVSALTKQAQSLGLRREVTINTDLCDEPDLPLKTKEALYRIAQEAMNNTVKHARARIIQLRLSSTHDEMVLEVTDDGLGFDPDGSYPGHMGLQSMRERAAQLGGDLDIASAPGQGTRVCVRVPSSSPVAAPREPAPAAA